MKNGSAGVKVRAGLKAGGLWGNHNRRLLIAVRTGVKAGGFWNKHNRRLPAAVRAG
jgi:hypothetical protein